MCGQCNARPTVIFPVTGHHCPLTSSSYYLVIEACAWTTCPRLLPESRMARSQTHDLIHKSNGLKLLWNRSCITDGCIRVLGRCKMLYTLSTSWLAAACIILYYASARQITHETTTTTIVLRLSGFFLGFPRWASTRKVNQSGFPGCPSCRQTNIVKALKAEFTHENTGYLSLAPFKNLLTFQSGRPLFWKTWKCQGICSYQGNVRELAFCSGIVRNVVEKILWGKQFQCMHMVWVAATECDMINAETLTL